MGIQLFSISLDPDGTTIVLASAWSMNLDASLSPIYKAMGIFWHVIFFEEVILITPATLN